MKWLPKKWPRGSDRQIIAIFAAVVTFIAAAMTAPAQGISRDEGVYLVAGEMYALWWKQALTSPGKAYENLDRSYSVNHEHPGLAKLMFGLSHDVFRDGLKVTTHLQAFRVPIFFFAAMLSYFLALLAQDLAGRAAGLLAPALFWLVPRHFYHSHPAVFDLPVTALWLATIYAYWRSLGRGPGKHTMGWGIAAGALFGAAISVKHNAWFIPPICFAHWMLTGGAGDLLKAKLKWKSRVKRLPIALIAMAVLGPIIFFASWPWLWHEPWTRFRGYLAFHLHHEHYSWHYLGQVMRQPPFPIAYPFVVTALTVPLATLAAMAGGLGHSIVAGWRALRARASSAFGDELLWTTNALFPILLIAHPQVPHFGGVKHWMHAMPFLAALGTRAIFKASHVAWPKRWHWLAGATSAAILLPGLWAVAHVHPFGTAAYNELAGGAAGAATLGMQRQFWGDNMAAVLPTVNAHAAPNTRVWFQEATYDAVLAYQRDGRLRADLRWVEGPEAAQIAIYHYHQEFRDKAFSVWTQFQTARPVHGLYLDEVPLIEVYARPGAWR